jgi:hypothetical protein
MRGVLSDETINFPLRMTKFQPEKRPSVVTHCGKLINLRYTDGLAGGAARPTPTLLSARG